MMIHFYSNALSIPINQDATFDNALRQLLDTIPPPSIIPTSPPEHHIYYNPSLPQPLSVKDECLEYLSSKVLVLEIEYRERCGRRAKLQRGIKAMWDELHITDRKLQMTESVTLEYLEEVFMIRYLVLMLCGNSDVELNSYNKSSICCTHCCGG